jgi:hypothetical protein
MAKNLISLLIRDAETGAFVPNLSLLYAVLELLVNLDSRIKC